MYHWIVKQKLSRKKLSQDPKVDSRNHWWLFGDLREIPMAMAMQTTFLVTVIVM
jgi:hypothetical protein